MKNYSGSEIKALKSGLRIFLMAIVLGLGTTAFAQQGGPSGKNGQRPGPAERFDRVLTLLVDSVGINEEQVTKVEAVNTKYEKIFTDVREEVENTDDRDAVRTKMKGIMTEYDKEITAILTKEQKETYSTMKKARMKKMKKMRANGEGKPSRGGSRGGN